jgi:hypothetical protein
VSSALDEVIGLSGPTPAAGVRDAIEEVTGIPAHAPAPPMSALDEALASKPPDAIAEALGPARSPEAAAPAAPSTVLGEAKRGWEAGVLETQRGHIGGGIVFNEIPEADGIRRAAALQEKINAIPPTTWDWSRPETWLPDLAHTTARAGPFMWESTVVGATYAMAGAMAAGTAAAVGGASLSAGPQAVATVPATAITVPVAAAAGGKVGMAVGAFKNAMEVEGGNAYLDMRQSGIDASLARPAALAIGVVNGAVELSQLGLILKRIPGADRKSVG